jgi:hypothetical protein
MNTHRPHDTSEYRATQNAAKKKRAFPSVAYDGMQQNHHDILFKNEKGDTTKTAECNGTRATQVALRRETRSRLNVGGDRIVLYTNGFPKKSGIDKGK